MTDLLLPTGAVVQVRIPAPPTITAAAPTPSVVLIMPTPGPPGRSGQDGSGVRVSNETPSGTKNGINTVFTLAHEPQPTSTAVYRNGLREVLTVGYAESGSNITFTTAPLSSDEITVDYLMEG